MGRVERALLLREQLLDRALARQGLAHIVLADARLHRRRADVAARHRVQLDDHPRVAAQVIRDVVRLDGPKLDD
jgi:hypothetical protein